VLGAHPEAVEASLLAEYQRDGIAEFWRGEITLRRLRVMVENLSDGSAAVVAARGHGWGAGEYALANLNDVVAQLLEVTRAVNSKDTEFHAPEPYPRPGAEGKGEKAGDQRSREQQDDIDWFQQRTGG